jgi:hypothetical protein
MLPKDSSRLVHAMLRSKNHLFEVGDKGNYLVPEEKLPELQEPDVLTYQDIRENRGRLHQERLRFDQSDAPKLSFYDKQKKTVSSFNICTTNHKRYTSVIDYSINTELAEYLTEPAPNGNRTYDEYTYHKLRSKYARNLFILFSGSGKKQEDGTRKDEFRFKKETLRQQLQIEGKYKHIAAFTSRLKQIEKEFSDIGIKFTWRYEHPHGNKKAPKMFFIEVDKGMQRYKSPRVVKKKEDLFSHVTGSIRHFLKSGLSITDAGIDGSREVFARYIQLTDGHGTQFKEFVEAKIRMFDGKKKSKYQNKTGYVINAIKGEVERMEREEEAKKKEYLGYSGFAPEPSEDAAAADVRARMNDTS